MREESAYLQSGHDIQNEELEKVGRDVCLIGFPVILLWSSARQEVKRCFSNLSNAAHDAVSLPTITQKQNESLHIYI